MSEIVTLYFLIATFSVCQKLSHYIFCKKMMNSHQIILFFFVLGHIIFFDSDFFCVSEIVTLYFFNNQLIVTNFVLSFKWDIL